MANNTGTALRNQLIYCVYVRNHGPRGTFADVQADLPRIKALGADILWLMPIHPIGTENRKGSLGSPYAVQDYRAINPEYGTLEDFTALCDAAHRLDMKVMIDVVYNHTAYGSVLMQQHPEYFYRLANGGFGNRAGQWSDVADLDYTNNPGLWEYQMETLCYWVRQGVDGFRSDVASLVPVEFWRQARQRVEAVKPGVVWLAESVHTSFLETQRRNGHACYSDGELYSAFDITYDYDIHALYEGYFAGRNSLNEYLEAMRRQESCYPQNYLKLRFTENHDQPRLAGLEKDAEKRRMWTAFTYFARGTTLLHAGQEAWDENLPSLFERDPVNWQGLNEADTAFFQKLAQQRRDGIVREGRYALETDKNTPGVARLWYYTQAGDTLAGIFNLELREGEAEVPLADGDYENLLCGQTVRVRQGRIPLSRQPVLLRGQAKAAA